MPHVDAALRRIECLGPSIPDYDDHADPPLDNLSDREHEIMRWVRIGKTNQEIGMLLCISANTVKLILQPNLWTPVLIKRPFELQSPRVTGS